MNDPKKPENPTFSIEMTDKQRTEVRGETPRGGKIEQDARASQEFIDKHVEGDSSAGSLDAGGWKDLDYDEKAEKKSSEQ